MVNRHRTRGESLAAAWGAVSASWSDLEALLAATDVVFVSTSSTRPLVGADMLAEAVAVAPDRRLTVLDLSVPRNVEPSARAVAGIRLYDLDDLQQLRCPASGFDAPAIAEAQRMLRHEIERLLRALDAREAAPRLAELHRTAAIVMEEESERALRELGDLSERERRAVRAMAERLVRRVLYPVSRALRDEGAVGDAPGPCRRSRRGRLTQDLIFPATAGLPTSPTGFSTFRHCGFTQPGQRGAVERAADLPRAKMVAHQIRDRVDEVRPVVERRACACSG